MPKKPSALVSINQEEGLLVRVDRKKLPKSRISKRKPLMDSGFSLKTGVPKITPRGPRRFWILGAVASLLLYHSYGILSGLYSNLSIVSYNDALIVGGFEMLASLVLIPIFLAKFFVWWHDRPRALKHVFDDPGLLD